MTRIEELMSQPGVAQNLLRQVISTAAGRSTTLKVNEGSTERILKATVLKQSGKKPAK
jgi:hypothetical protein